MSPRNKTSISNPSQRRSRNDDQRRYFYFFFTYIFYLFGNNKLLFLNTSIYKYYERQRAWGRGCEHGRFMIVKGIQNIKM